MEPWTDTKTQFLNVIRSKAMKDWYRQQRDAYTNIAKKIAYTNQLRGAFVAWRSYVADRKEETDTDDSDLPPPLVDSSDESNPDPDETQMYADEYESDSDSDSNSDPAFDRSMDRHRTMGHVVFHGGGWTPLTQVNDTTLHARALRAFLEHFRQEHGMPKQRSCSRQ